MSAVSITTITTTSPRTMTDGDVAATIAAEQPGLERYIRGLVRDPDEVADISQDAFVRLLLAARAGQAPDNPGAWMRRVAHNAVVSASRHRQVVQRSADRLFDGGVQASTEDDAIRRERDQAIVRSLHDARPADRTAMILAAQGFEASEIGRALGRTPLATRALLCRARGRLRVRLESAEAF
jgi:RNA polymerase sigma-70 factor (ECF subfamily)